MSGLGGWLRRKAKRKLDKLRRSRRYARLMADKEREFRDDPNFDLSAVPADFAPRALPPAPGDEAILARIAASYNLAREAQRAAAACYQVGNEWLPIYENQLGEVMAALRASDLPALARIYGNFWRDPCSFGLLGLPVDMEKCFFGKAISTAHRKLFLFDTLHRYKLWKGLAGRRCTSRDLASPDVGNPYGHVLDGVFVKSGADYLHHYATAIGRLLRGRTGRRTVVELGGGFGGMAYFLCRDQEDLCYVDFDLPENMALTAWYLLKAFPGRRVLLYGEAPLTAGAIADSDIVLMPNFEFPRMPASSADVVFNSYSLAEMSPDAIRNYVSEFARISCGYVLHINHTERCVLGADDFGFDPDRFDLLYKVPALWNGGRNPDMDEYEYLYKTVR